MPRLLFIDNLRWTIIILVISMHAADTYSPLGNWYFVDRRPLSEPAFLAFAAWQMYLQAFFMGLLFFIAGVFVPGSVERKGPRRFLKDRAFRLGLPVLFYMCVVGPVTEYFVARSWTSAAPTSFANEWWKHLRNGEILQENGPLWFCLALLIFSTAYVFLPAGKRAEDWGKPVPRHREIFLFALFLAACTFTLRLVFRSGSSFLNMQLGDFAQYILLFAVGVRSGRTGWIEKMDSKLARSWCAVILPLGFAFWLAILLVGGALSGKSHAYSGGWYWQSAALDVWEAFTCVALCLGLLTLYRDRFPAQGRIARFLSANAFSVYVFHPPVVILLARAIHPVALEPLLKFVLLTLLATAASFVLSAAVFRRVPFLRAIL